MTLIRKPCELILQPKIKALIYGQAGTGKSTLALSAPRPLMIDCDNGIHRVNAAHRSDALQVESYNQVLELLNENLSAYDSIVIDTGGKLLDFMAEYIIRRNSKMGKTNGTLTLQGYGERKQEFSAFCKKISLLGKHLVFVAHRETKTEGDQTRFIPMFGGSNYDSLVTELDLVLYLEAIGKQRILTADPTDRNDGKNTCNLPGSMPLPLVISEKGEGLPNTFVENNIIKPYTARLEADSSQRKAFDVLMEEIKQEIALTTDALSLNDLVARIPEFKHIGSSLAATKELITKRAKELEFSFNKETKKYE